MPQGTPRVLDVGGDALGPRQSAPVTYGLRSHGEPAGGEQRLPSRFVRLHATANVLSRRHLEVSLELGAELIVSPIPGEESDDARAGGAQGCKDAHGVSRFGARKAAMRSAVWCHSLVSRASCFRPAAVSA